MPLETEIRTPGDGWEYCPASPEEEESYRQRCLSEGLLPLTTHQRCYKRRPDILEGIWIMEHVKPGTYKAIFKNVTGHPGDRI